MISPIDFLYKFHPLLSVGIISNRPEEKEFCVVCNRLVADTESGLFTVANVYGNNEIHCVSCQLLFHPNENCFGIEGRRGRKTAFCNEADYSKAMRIIKEVSDTAKTVKALKDAGIKMSSSAKDTLSCELVINEGNAVAAKLGMLPSCLLLVTKEKGVLYAPGKYFDKLNSAVNPPFEIVQAAEVMAIQDCMKRMTKEDLPFLFISLSKKKADQVRHLELTTNLDNIKLCRDDGVDYLKTECISAFFEWHDAIGAKAYKPKHIKELLSTMKQFFKGNRKYEQVLEKLQDVKSISSWISTLPDDPHEKISVITLIERAL
jgi:hypothetical protein